MTIEKLYSLFLTAGKVSTDTRQIVPGSLFFALKGDRFNANQFAAEALNKGAHYAVIDDPQFNTSDQYIVVDDVLTTLQQLAKYHRSQLTIPIIGLTGSNGKTTSKELLYAVLSKKFKTLATKGNLNNHIGVPLTILSIDNQVEVAVIEMGANHVGEIALLSSIANPTHGFITNIGKAHIGTFGGFDNIIRGKSELYQHLLTTDGVVFINSQDYILANMAKRFTNPIMYPGVDDYYTCSLVDADPFVKVKTASGEVLETKLIGKYNFENIATALCIGQYFRVDPKLAHEAIAKYIPSNMRSQMLQKETNTIILDTYNANPTSMAASIENLAELKADRKVLIIGDMFELEEEAEKEHGLIGTLILEKGFSEVYLCGELMAAAHKELPRAKHFYSKNDLIEDLKQNPIHHATILVKASRGIGLETILDYL